MVAWYGSCAAAAGHGLPLPSSWWQGMRVWVVLVSDQVRVKIESGKNDLKSSSSLPLHAKGRRRTMPFKTTLFWCSVFFFFKKKEFN